MREWADCRHRKDGVCICPSNTFTPFKCPYTDPEISQKEGYIPCPDWKGTKSYVVHRPKHFTVTLVWDIEADSQTEAEQKVREVMEQVDGELEEVSMEQDGQALILTIDEEDE